jgi:hypothetical protein
VAETDEERRRRQKADRQRRWRLRRKLEGQLEQSAAVAVPEGESLGPGPLPGLPGHMANPIFGALLEIGTETLTEAQRYTQYVQSMPPGEALKPLRPGASPPASEARLQRAEARAVLMQMAATPISAIRVLRNAGEGFDLAAEAQAITERRSEKFPGAYVDDRGEFVIPGTAEDAGPGV